MTDLQDVVRSALERADEAWNHEQDTDVGDYLLAMSIAVEYAIVEASGGPDHVINVKGFAWTIQHPLVERFESGDRTALFSCKVTQMASAAADSIRLSEGDGKYRLWFNAGALLWERLP